MKSKIWGPYAWNLYHTIPLYLQMSGKTFPEAEEWVRLWKNILPCPTCQEHYGAHVEAVQPAELNLSDPHNLIQWSLYIHNHVSASLGKEKWSLEQFYQNYNYPEELRFWSRNLLIFIYLCIHSPHVVWKDFVRFLNISRDCIPFGNEEEQKLWNQMIKYIPEKRSEAFAWFEEFKPQWLEHWEHKWPNALNKSTYLKKMRWIMTRPNRPSLPAIGAFIPFT